MQSRCKKFRQGETSPSRHAKKRKKSNAARLRGSSCEKLPQNQMPEHKTRRHAEQMQKIQTGRNITVASREETQKIKHSAFEEKGRRETSAKPNARAQDTSPCRADAKNSDREKHHRRVTRRNAKNQTLRV